MTLKSNWKYPLAEADIIWLKACYNGLNTGQDVKLREVKATLLDKIPIDYSTDSLKNAGLCKGNKITLLGILNIDEQTKYYDWAKAIISTIKNYIIANPKAVKIEAPELVRGTKLPTPDILKTFGLISDLGEFSTGSGSREGRITHIGLDRDEVFEQYLQFNSIDDLIDDFVERQRSDSTAQTYFQSALFDESVYQAASIHLEDLHFDIDDIWYRIAQEFEIDQSLFREKLGFIRKPYLLDIIIRDIAHAYILSKLGFSKPSVILAGSVIEVLLQTYLDYNEKKGDAVSFNNYIETCEREGLLKAAIGHLSHYVRHFRNYVHLENEESERHRISKATSIGAVSSIFTIVNDF